VIRKAEITFEPDDVDRVFGHEILTEKMHRMFSERKSVPLHRFTN
jgi:hypothetical protein